MKALLVLLAVAVAIAGGAETAAPGPEETTTTASPATLSPETSGANPAADDSEPNAEPQRALDFWDRDNKPEACLNFKCKTAPRECIERDQKCDGRKHCRDGSDEDPIACEVSTTSLEPGEFMSFKANLSWQHDAIEVYSCKSQQCNGLVPLELMFVNKKPDKQLEFFKQTGCNAKGQQCTFKEKRRKPTWNLKEEYTYVVENRIDHLTLKRLDYPDKIGTVEIPLRTNNVVVRPSNFPYYENSKSYTVTFGERKRLPAFYSMLMTKLRDHIRDNSDTATLDTYTAIASDMAVKDEEKRAVRWMKLAVATRPVPTNKSGYILTTDVIQFLTGAHGAAKKAKELNEEQIKNQLNAKGNEYSKELGRKVNTNTETLYDSILPQIENVVNTLENQTVEAKQKKDKAGQEISNKEEEIELLDKGVIIAKFFKYVGKVLGLVSTAMGVHKNEDIQKSKTKVSNVGKGFDLIGEKALGKLQADIESLQSDIKKLKKTEDSMKNLLELLTMCLDLARDLDKVKGSAIGLRGWLAGGAMLNFRTRLVMMSAEDLPAATSGLILIDIVREVGRSIKEMLDKIEWYETQQVIVDLTTPPLSSADSTEVREGLGAMRALVGQHMVVADYHATMRSMQLYALPYCSVLVTSEAERCLEGYDLNGIVTCVGSIYEGLLARLKKDKASISGTSRVIGSFYRDEDEDRAFITWSNQKHRPLIADVLSGKQVVLPADVYEGASDIYVVKFREIMLQFWHDDDEIRKELKAALNEFKMSLTHMGSSHFRCGDKALTLSHRVITINSTFRSDQNGMPEWFSEEYSKLRDGDMVLSPYGIWSVQLLPDNKNADFSKLQRFASLVDMSLSGEGSYVSQDVSCEGCVWDTEVAAPHRDKTASGPRKLRLYHRNKASP